MGSLPCEIKGLAINGLGIKGPVGQEPGARATMTRAGRSSRPASW
jgi:hypothetical protein